jgi:drug/metabolite transporter (DMT)-like permease
MVGSGNLGGRCCTHCPVALRFQQELFPTATGDLLVVISMIAAVVMTLLTKELIREHDPLFVTALMMIIGTAILALWLILSGSLNFHFSQHAWMAVGAQGILATAAAYALWNWGLARVPASRAGVFCNLEPLIGSVLGVLVLGELLTALAVIGATLIIGSAVYFSTIDF